jgi:8-oxo-dGTP diphosphatase
MATPRLAVRALVLRQNRLLIVNAWPEGKSDLWCAPGGGVERGQSLPDNLKREIHEECGLDIAVGAPCLVNEFHDPTGSFHQVDIYFHTTIIGGQIDPAWRDPEGVVTARRFVTEAELRRLRFKPDSLPDLAFGEAQALRAFYDPLEPIVL